MRRTAVTRGTSDPDGGNDQGSILIVLLFISFISIVAVTISMSAFGQLSLSTTSTNRNDTLQAAMSGVQAELGQIRAASSGGYTVPANLPCGTATGVTNGTGTSSYSVSVQYYAESVSGSYDSVSCLQGTGPEVTTPGDSLARAVITSCSPASDCPSSGTSAQTATWRRVVSTYTFETTNVNIPGGIIYSYQDQECLVAKFNNGSSPAGGVSLDVTNNCSSGNSQYSLEQFEYTSTWNLAIDIDGTQYCVQDSEDLSSPQSSSLSLVQCSGNTTNAAEQWGVNDNAGVEGVATTGSPSGQPNGWCLDNPLGGTTIPSGTTQTAAAILTSCQGGFSPSWSWQMSPSVGAGGAAPSGTGLIGSTDQMVNYQEFGLCLDVTNQTVSSTYLIDYDCKQFPDTSQYPIWNQRWCFRQLSTSGGNEVGILYTPYGQTTCTNVTNAYCAVSPGIPASSSSTAWVTVTSCSSTAVSTSYPANELWTAWGGNGGSLHDYTWTDYNGDCLETNPQDAQNPGGNTNWSTIQVDTCSGSYAQKWNAPPTLGASQVSNTHEGTSPSWTNGSP